MGKITNMKKHSMIKTKTVFAIICLMAMVVFGDSCTSKNDFDKGKNQLEMQGYTDIKNTGYSIFCCSDSDDFSTGFTAKDKHGNTVNGCFCSSFSKGITIRFE